MKTDQDSAMNWKKIFPWLPEEVLNSFKLDEVLTGAEWNNPTHLATLRLYDKYDSTKHVADGRDASVVPEAS
jgi:hypothetical protein